MILEIFVAIFVVIFTTMMAASSTYETDWQRMQRVEKELKKLKEKGNDGGFLKKMQADGRKGEEHYESFGLNMDVTSSDNMNVSRSDNKPVNKGLFGGAGTLGNLLVEAAPPPVEWNWSTSGEGNLNTTGGKYGEPRDGKDGINGIDGINGENGEKGEKGDKGEPGLGGGGGEEDDVAGYLKGKGGLYIDLRGIATGAGATNSVIGGVDSEVKDVYIESESGSESDLYTGSEDVTSSYAVETAISLSGKYDNLDDIKTNKDELMKEYGSNTYENAVKILDLAENDKRYDKFKKYFTERKSIKSEYSSDEEKEDMINLANNVIEKYQRFVSGLHKLDDKSSIKNIDRAMKKIEGFRKYIENEIK